MIKCADCLMEGGGALCRYCNGESLLFGEVEVIDNILFFDKEDTDIVDMATVKQLQECVGIDIQIDRGHLVLWIGEDRGCLDHTEDRVKINYCPICGQKFS